MALLVLGILLYSSITKILTIAGVFGIGLFFGLLYTEQIGLIKRLREETKKAKSTEINRDVFQIVLGLILLTILELYKEGPLLIFSFILIAYAFNGLYSKSGFLKNFYRFLSHFERRKEYYGLGAAYIASGTAILIGFISNIGFLEASIAVLFFADSIATIVGIKFKKQIKLPYNHKKTLAGSIAFLIVSFISLYLINFSLVSVLIVSITLTIIESASNSIDDNILLPVALVIFYYLMYVSCASL
ncbi:MAG: diacylglycerol/polyprenol kinase family protein [Candidatus Micrarchaeia archaeon]